MKKSKFSWRLFMIRLCIVFFVDICLFTTILVVSDKNIVWRAPVIVMMSLLVIMAVTISVYFLFFAKYTSKRMIVSGRHYREIISDANGCYHDNCMSNGSK